MCVRLCECVSVCPQGGDTKITFPPLRNEAADFASTARGNEITGTHATQN